MARQNKRKFGGDTFTLMAIRTKKKSAQDWAESARKSPHNARARVVKTKSEYLVYVHGYRRRRKK